MSLLHYKVLSLQILHADFDEEDTAFLLTVSIAKAGVTQPAKTMTKTVLAKTAASRLKEKSKPKEPPKEKPKEKPKPKEPPKEKPREEAYFETEEYEVCFTFQAVASKQKNTRCVLLFKQLRFTLLLILNFQFC